jgi:integrase
MLTTRALRRGVAPHRHSSFEACAESGSRLGVGESTSPRRSRKSSASRYPRTNVAGPTKTHADRTIELPKPISDLLNDHLAVASPGGNGRDDLVFTSLEGAPIRQSQFYRRHFKPAVRKALPAEQRGLRFHDLRHTCAALLIAQGAHALAIKEQLGHSSITITMDRYGHLLPSAHERTADRLAAVFAEAATPPENVRELRA